MEQAVAIRASVPQTIDPTDDFNLQDLRIFSSIPDHRDWGIVAMKGIVVVYDRTPLYQEGVVEGAFYVRESQSPAGCRPWQDWLADEWEDRGRRRAGPGSRPAR